MKKTFYTIILGLLFTTILEAQPASALWELSSTTTTSVSVSGNIAGQDESFSEMYIYNYAGPNNSQRVTTLTGSWPAETEQNQNRYIQFAVSPETGYNFTVTSVMMDLGASGGSNMKANIWYSKDPSFTSATQLNTSVLNLPNGSFLIPSPNYTIDETVNEGETFYLRIYPWYTTSATGKYVCPQNVLISGTSIPSSAIFTSEDSLDLGIVVAGSLSLPVDYSVYGTNLPEDVVVLAPEYFELSLDNITFLDSILLPVSGGSLSSTTLYVRFHPESATGTVTGVITHTSGSISADLPLSGISITTEPTISSAVVFSEVTGNSIGVNFSGGNGSNRIVVVKSGSAVDWEPEDGTYINGVSSDFSLAADQGSGNKVVYDGSGSTVNVTGLTGSTTYYFSVFEYNVGTNNSQNYFTSSPGTGLQTTLEAPTILVSPSLLSFGNVPVNTYSEELTYSLSANTLTPLIGNISVTAPVGFEISTTSGSGFSSFLNIPYTGGQLSSTTIYVRFFPTTESFYNDNIVNAGANAESEYVNVTGYGMADSPNEFNACSRIPGN